MDKGKFYRKIPKVDVLLGKDEISELLKSYGREAVTEAIRIETESLRTLIEESNDEGVIENALSSITSMIKKRVESAFSANMVSVINATGTILHTNLGRAPISKEHGAKLLDMISGYSNLEYSLEKGQRGERYSHFESLLCSLTGAEAAMAVNNNASAVLLVLSSLANGGEVIVSRGELVEIGGKFRVPDVMEQSGATLVEVGTTNKTHLSDYREAFSEETKAVLKVHTSNYRIIGFTQTVAIDELSEVAKERNVPLIEDIGSGVLVDLSQYGISYEPTVQDSIKAGADVVCFSGDKLLGGPQAGIIVGKKEYIEKMKKNQLTRALRIDKFTAAALELTLLEYLNPDKLSENIPVLRMIKEDASSVKKRAFSLKRALKGYDINAEIGVEPCESQIGGGALPLERIESFALTVVPKRLSIFDTEDALRRAKKPVIGRVSEDKIFFDMRCVESSDIKIMAEVLGEIL